MTTYRSIVNNAVLQGIEEPVAIQERLSIAKYKAYLYTTSTMNHPEYNMRRYVSFPIATEQNITILNLRAKYVARVWCKMYREIIDKCIHINLTPRDNECLSNVYKEVSSIYKHHENSDLIIKSLWICFMLIMKRPIPFRCSMFIAQLAIIGCSQVELIMFQSIITITEFTVEDALKYINTNKPTMISRYNSYTTVIETVLAVIDKHLSGPVIEYVKDIITVGYSALFMTFKGIEKDYLHKLEEKERTQMFQEETSQGYSQKRQRIN